MALRVRRRRAAVTTSGFPKIIGPRYRSARQGKRGRRRGGDENGAFLAPSVFSEYSFDHPRRESGGDEPPGGYSRGPPCPWPAPTSTFHRRRTPSGASARFGSPRSEASSGDRAWRSAMKYRLVNRRGDDRNFRVVRYVSGRVGATTKSASQTYQAINAAPTECAAPSSLHTPFPRETSAARPARARPPLRAEVRPQAAPDAQHARRP